jgi:hypothetical protein
MRIVFIVAASLLIFTVGSRVVETSWKDSILEPQLWDTRARVPEFSATAARSILKFIGSSVSGAVQMEPVPTIIWAPSETQLMAAPGESKSVGVSFSSSEDMNDVLVQVVGEVKSFLRVEPSMVPSIRAGLPIPLTLIITPASDVPLRTFVGTIQLKGTGHAAKTFVKPLPITLNIWRSVTDKGLILYYPAHWQLNPKTLAVSGPLALDNFSNSYEQGGAIPIAGARIDISTVQFLPTLSLNDMAKKDFAQAEINSIEPIFLLDQVGIRITFRIPFTSKLAYKSIAVYLYYNISVYRLILFYNFGDPLENQFLRDFQQILATVQFVR